MPTGIVPSGSGARARRVLSSAKLLLEGSTRPARLAAATPSTRPAREVSARTSSGSGGLVEQVAGPLDECGAETDDEVTRVTDRVCQLGCLGLEAGQIELRQIDLRQFELAQIDRGDLDVGKSEHAANIAHSACNCKRYAAEARRG